MSTILGIGMYVRITVLKHPNNSNVISWFTYKIMKTI